MYSTAPWEPVSSPVLDGCKVREEQTGLSGCHLAAWRPLRRVHVLEEVWGVVGGRVHLRRHRSEAEQVCPAKGFRQACACAGEVAGFNQVASSSGCKMTGIRLWIWATRGFAAVVRMAKVLQGRCCPSCPRLQRPAKANGASVFRVIR